MSAVVRTGGAVRLAFGRGSLEVVLPVDADVIRAPSAFGPISDRSARWPSGSGLAGRTNTGHGDEVFAVPRREGEPFGLPLADVEDELGVLHTSY